MDCCGDEGHAAGDARFDIKQVADEVHVAVAAPAYKVNSNTAPRQHRTHVFHGGRLQVATAA
jgi:hypothetical protein